MTTYIVQEVGDTVEGDFALDSHRKEHEDLSHTLAKDIEH